MNICIDNLLVISLIGIIMYIGYMLWRSTPNIIKNMMLCLFAMIIIGNLIDSNQHYPHHIYHQKNKSVSDHKGKHDDDSRERYDDEHNVRQLQERIDDVMREKDSSEFEREYRERRYSQYMYNS